MPVACYRATVPIGNGVSGMGQERERMGLRSEWRGVIVKTKKGAMLAADMASGMATMLLPKSTQTCTRKIVVIDTVGQ